MCRCAKSQGVRTPVDSTACGTRLDHKGLWIRIRLDPNYFGKLDRDLNKSQMPDPHQTQYSGAVEAQNRAIKGRGRSQWRRGGSKWSRLGSVDQWSRFASL